MADYKKRCGRLRRLLRKTDAHAILVTSEPNVTYLTGFTGDSSYLLLLKTGEVLLTDQRYTTQLEEECPGLDLFARTPTQSMLVTIEKVVKKAKIGSLAVEADSLSIALYQQMTGQLTKVTLISTSGLVEQLREIKDKEEIAAICVAIDQAQRAFGVVRASLRGDQTEKQVADQIEHQIRLFGGKSTSFPPIVAVGAWAALPHAVPGQRRIDQSNFVLIDWGANQQLYMSDLTRVLVTGKISTKLERIYGVVLKAQLAAIAAIKPGASMKKVDAAARGTIDKAGYGKRFGHGLGHGIGLEIHEAPRLAANVDRPLKAGMVVTVEPGIYLPGWGGVRIEDDVLVTRTGHQVLSSVTKDLSECVVELSS